MRTDCTLYAGSRPADVMTGEKLYCVVRAFAVVTGKPYATIHELCAKHGRKFGHKTSHATVMATADELGLDVVEWSIKPRHALTLNQFIKENPVGRFYVHRKGHAFAVIDGVVHDWQDHTGPRSRITVIIRG